MKIAHISDLHFNSLYKKYNISQTEKLLALAVENEVDHVVITGDISDNAEEKDFRTFRRMLKDFGLFKSQKTSVVVGNHDIFGGVFTAMDIVNFPSKCLATNYAEKLDLFTNQFQELFLDTIRISETQIFPYVKELRDVVFLGLNSIPFYSKLNNPFASNGRIDSLQLENANKLMSVLDSKISKTKRRIALVHHHFYRKKEKASASNSPLWDRVESFSMKLRGKKKVIKFLGKHGFDLVLHGHSHEIREYRRNDIQFLNAGGCIENRDNDSRFFIIDTENPEYLIDLKNAKSGMAIHA
ncbi:MAG: metallophosphoesterase [Melioribacteraceae bacterium]|nr:metallophosphoesterase [Melioribacteraceae bacterium]MCF8263284.1 metallophosphoesterase [Melioribacteraceae bacterium]MCF8412974.1 metallophosphoesterase [Melioribacteraceae bacterium]MCF8432418.1 metallophosphoesterase [Melioribacteraceae bacterium]